MATAAQIAVNQANALKHGIDAASIVIPGEDRAVYEALAAPTSPRDWPPTDEKTGRPMYFAG